ncbi:MAG: PQQ-dependent sugar dehydrogenase [Verrucomicrobiales bacterium]
MSFAQWTTVGVAAGVNCLACFAADFVVLEDDRPARALVPSMANGGNALGTTWTAIDFDDNAWTTGRTGVGYDVDPGVGGDYRALARLDVSAMRRENPSVFIRVPFAIEPATRASLRRLTLQVKYDDGFAAWFNGTRVAEENAPPILDWNSLASESHDTRPEEAYRSIDLTQHLSLLRDGSNVLAFQGLNAFIDSDDLLLAPRLVASDSPPPVWPSLNLVEVGGVGPLGFPVAVRHASDGSNRLFIVERPGRIKVWRNGSLTPFLDITDRVLTSNEAGAEHGLLGLAFPPGFGVLFQHFYVFYTTSQSPNAGDPVIARFFLSPGPSDSAVADPASERLVLHLNDPAGNNIGGDLHFGIDGYLYVGLGDGGGDNDPDNRAQNPISLWGKMLRLDTESGPPESSTYAVPIDNPFVGVQGVRPEIWHFGFRHPRRWSFDRDTSEMWIGDAGQDAWEEISFAPPLTPALNFGWRRYEGGQLRPSEPTLSTDQAATQITLGTLTHPIAQLPRSNNLIDVVGGYVYRGSEFTRLQGVYLYAIQSSGTLHGIQSDGPSWVHRELASGVPIHAFGEAEDGTVLALMSTDIDNPGSGRLYKIVDNTDQHRLVIRDAARNPVSGLLSFSFGAVIGKFYQPEVSSDLVTWQPIGPVLPAHSQFVPFTEPNDPQAGIAPRYFRVREL